MWFLSAAIARQSGSHADQTALERMARGDHDALAELYDRYGRLLYSLALRILRDTGDAEDIVQDVFSQAWRQAVALPVHPRQRRRLADEPHAQPRHRPGPRPSRAAAAGGRRVRALDVPDMTEPVDEQLALSSQAALIRAAVDELSVLQRVAIELAFYRG